MKIWHIKSITVVLSTFYTVIKLSHILFNYCLIGWYIEEYMRQRVTIGLKLGLQNFDWQKWLTSGYFDNVITEISILPLSLLLLLHIQFLFKNMSFDIVLFAFTVQLYHSKPYRKTSSVCHSFEFLPYIRNEIKLTTYLLKVFLQHRQEHTYWFRVYQKWLSC